MCEQSSNESISVSSSTEDEAYVSGLGCLALFNNFFTNFETEKRVVLRSKWLRIPELCLVLAIILYIVVYKMIVQLALLAQVEVRAHPLIDFSMPATNFKSCSSAEGNCDWVLPHQANLTYCLLGECKKFNVVDVASKVGSAGVFITTSLMQVHERACEGTEAECSRNPWVPLDEKQHRRIYVQGPESFIIKFRHRFTAPKYDSVERPSAQGLLVRQTEPGRARRLHCDNLPHCHEGKAHWDRLYPEVCGTATGTDDQTCMSRPMGDYISIAVLLSAANVSLDDTAWPGKQVTWRDTGIPIMLEVSFSNLHPVDFWTWPFGTFVRYTLMPRHMPFSPKDEYVQREVHLIGDNQRVVTTRKGIYFYITSQGTLGTFEFVTFLANLVISLAIVRYAKAVVDIWLTRIYSLLSWTRHVNLLFEYTTFEETPNDHELRACMEKEEGLDANEILKLSARAQRLRTKRLARVVDQFS